MMPIPPIGIQGKKNYVYGRLDYALVLVFGKGRFAPGTDEGRRLLAHELTHVIQQGGSLNLSPVHADDLLQRKVILKRSELKKGSAFIKEGA